MRKTPCVDGMMRPHGDFEQLAFAVGLNHRRTVPAVESFGFGFYYTH
jgi:hypothetical protein